VALTPAPDEVPFFCLLEDDKLITKVSVETDQLLEDVSPGATRETDVRLLIRVSIRPYDTTFWNLHFG
jgi:hypothetical protein